MSIAAESREGRDREKDAHSRKRAGVSRAARRTVLALGVSAALFGGAAGCAAPTARAPRPTDEPTRDPTAESAPVTWPESGVSFADYARRALERNPAVLAARARAEAARHRVAQGRALPNPTLSWEYSTQRVDTRHRVGVTQMLPAFGKLSGKESVAAQEAAAAEWLYEAEKWRLFERLAEAFYNYRYLFHAIAAGEEHLRLLGELEASVEAHYRVGAAAWSDVLNARMERERASLRLANDRERRRAQSAALAALLNLPAETLLPWPPAEEPPPLDVEAETCAPNFEETNPELHALDARLEAAQRFTTLARREGRPDWMLGAEWMQMTDMGGEAESDLSVMIGISLPLWRGRIREGIREAESSRNSVAWEREALLRELRASWEAAALELRDAERRRALFTESLIPLAREAAAASAREYAEGGSELSAALTAQRTALEMELEAARAVADREIARVRLRRLAGHPPADAAGEALFRRAPRADRTMPSKEAIHDAEK